MTTEPPWPWPKTMDALVAAPASHRVLLENDRVRVLEVVIEPRTRAHPPGGQRDDRRRARPDQVLPGRHAAVRVPGALRVPARRAGALDGARGPALCPKHRRAPLPRNPRRAQVMPAPIPDLVPWDRCR